MVVCSANPKGTHFLFPTTSSVLKHGPPVVAPMPASRRSAGVHVYGKRTGLMGGASRSVRNQRPRPGAKPAPVKHRSTKKNGDDVDVSSDDTSSDQEAGLRVRMKMTDESKDLVSELFSCPKTTLGELPDIGDYYYGVLENEQQRFVRNRIRHFVLGVCGSSVTACSENDDDDDDDDGDSLSRASFNLSAAFRGGVSLSQSSAPGKRKSEAASSTFMRSTSAPGALGSFAPSLPSGHRARNPGKAQAHGTGDMFTRSVSAPGEGQVRRMTERDWDGMGKNLGSQWLEVWQEIRALRYQNPYLAQDLMRAIAKYYGELLSRKYPVFLAKKMLQPGFEPHSNLCQTEFFHEPGKQRTEKCAASKLVDQYRMDRESFLREGCQNFAELLPDLGRYYYLELESPQQKKAQEHFRQFRASLDKCAMFRKVAAERKDESDNLNRKQEAADCLAAKWLLDAISCMRAVFIYSKEHQQQWLNIWEFRHQNLKNRDEVYSLLRQIESYYVDTLLGRNREFFSTFAEVLRQDDLQGAKVKHAPGLRWKNLGSQRPKTGNEIHNTALADSLKKSLRLAGADGAGSQIQFSEKEFAAFEVSYLAFHSFIKVGETFFKPDEHVVEDEQSRELRIRSEPLLFEDTIGPLAARAKMGSSLQQSKQFFFGARSKATTLEVLSGAKKSPQGTAGASRQTSSRACVVQ